MTDTGDIAAHKLQVLVLERRDPSLNMARFYVLAIEPTLFGDAALVREWGRIGSLGRRRLDLQADAATAVEALEVWLQRKARRAALNPTLVNTRSRVSAISSETIS